MKTVIVTPSHAPDLERCRVLAASIDRWVSGHAEHILIVDSADQADFARLTGESRRVISKEQLLPWWIRRMPLSSRWWLSLTGLPLRGWILQQLVKLALIDYVDADVLLFADSDAAFIRPFDVNSVCSPSAVRHFRAPLGPRQKADRRYRNWYRAAADLLGLPSAAAMNWGYIAQLNAWRREHIVALHRRIEQCGGSRWHQQLARRMDFSEFVLYGCFVESLAGDPGHHWTRDQLCHSSWFYPTGTPRDLDRFVADVQPQHVAVHLQSNLGLSSKRTAELLERITAATAVS